MEATARLPGGLTRSSGAASSVYPPSTESVRYSWLNAYIRPCPQVTASEPVLGRHGPQGLGDSSRRHCLPRANTGSHLPRPARTHKVLGVRHGPPLAQSSSLSSPPIGTQEGRTARRGFLIWGLCPGLSRAMLVTAGSPDDRSRGYITVA